MENDEEISQLRQRDVGRGIDQWLDDPESLGRADKFMSRLLARVLFEPVGRALVYGVLSVVVIGTVVLYIWAELKR